MPTINYTDIFEDSLNEIYVFSEQTLCFLEVNRGARENLGYTMEELRQLTPLELKLEYNQQTFAELIAPLRNEEKEKIIFETTHRRKDGTFYPVEVHLHLSEIKGERVFVAIILDITHRQEAEAKSLQLALEQERVRLLREFIGDVSHDLRTPLAQASTSLYLLQRQALNKLQQGYVRRTDAALKRVSRMIDKMFQLSELDLQDNYDMSPVDVSQPVSDIVEDNRVLARSNDIQLVYEPHSSPAIAEVDVYFLIRAIENVLSNAIDYTPPGGTVTLRVNTDDTQITISVTDAGPGIAPEHLPHIFERFYRADESRDTSDGSNGLGLSISKKIIDKHGGTIDVETIQGAGTTFHIRLPKSPEPAI